MMSYLSRLKQLHGGKIFTHTPETEPTKLTKGGFGGFVSTDHGAHVNIPASNEPEKVGAGNTATIQEQQFDPEAWEERAAICEFDGGLSRDEAEAIAWLEDDRRRCWHCLNLLPNGVCKVASPQGPVVANRGYRPVDMLRRCEGYRPCLDDPDRRNGLERWWPGLIQKGANDE